MPLDRIALIYSPDYFAELCIGLFAAEYEDFQTIDDSGGDGGNDGYSESNETLFQLYCPEKPRTSDAEYIKKIKKDLVKAKSLADSGKYQIKNWIFVTPAKLREPVQTFIRTEATKLGFKGIAWSSPKLGGLLATHEELRQRFSDLFDVETEKIIKEVRDNQIGVDEVKSEYRDKVNLKYKKRIDQARDQLKSGDAVGAKKEYERILSEMEEEVSEIDSHLLFRAKNNLGNCEQNLGNDLDAVRLYREAYLHSPEDKIGRINQAVALTLEKKFDEALKKLEELSSEYFTDEHFIVIKCNTLKSLGRYEELYRFLESADEAKLLLTFKGIEMMESKNEIKAVEFFEKVLELDPNDEQVMMWASQCILIGGRYPKIKTPFLS